MANNEQPEPPNHVDVFAFYPRELLDLKPMRELPEKELAALTAIPADVLNLGYDQARPEG